MKNKKKQSRFSQLSNTHIAAFRTRLEQMRDDLLKIVQRKKEEVVPPDHTGDEGDIAVRSLERDLVFEQSGTERRMLDEIEAALRRMEKNTYGICEACLEPITLKRLKAIPYARYCIKCQVRFDKS